MNWRNLRLPSGATRIGAEYHFPCLVTGQGKDRAWVNPDAQLLGCRCVGPDGGLEGDDLRAHAEALGIWEPAGMAADAQQTVYVYENAAGARVFDVVRFETAPGQKTFRQRHGPPGAYVWRRPAAGRGLLYRLPAVVAAIQVQAPILIVEGEKDVERLAMLGVTATCNAGGAGKFTREHAQHLAGAADVRIVPDDDTPGREHATRVLEQLAKVGVTATVLQPWLEDGETKADISSWLDMHSGCDAAAVLALPVRQAALPPAEAPVADPPAEGAAGSAAVYDERSLADAYLASVTDEDGLVTRRCDVTREQWYVWEQGWGPTDTVTREIADLGRRIYARPPSKSSPQVTADPRTGGKRTTARGAELFAACAPGVLTPPSAWDATPHVIGLTDGRVLEYRVGGDQVDVVFRNEQPDDLIRTRTGILPCSADAFEKSRVADFLLEILPAELLPFLQRFFGAGVIAADGLDRVGFFYGPGGSGKTTLVEGVLAALGGDGGYGVSCLASHVMVSAAWSHETRLARLASKRVIVATEIAQAATLDEAILKDLSGGGTLSARFVRRDAFQFRHRGIVCLVGNNAPRLRARDSGILRRLLVFPFKHQPARVDPTLRPALREAPEAKAAWLRWLCEGARDYLRDGLGEIPPEVTAETTRYSETADPLSEFVNDFLAAEPGRIVPMTAVHRAYLQWANERGEAHPLNARAFNAALVEGFGFLRDRSHGTRVWKNLVLHESSGTSGTQDIARH